LTCVSDQPFSLAFESDPRLSSVRCVLQLGLRINLRLASRANLPALPSNPTPDSSSIRRILRFCLPISFRLSSVANLPALPSKSTSNLHRLLHPPASLSDQPPTCVGYCVLQFYQRFNFRLPSDRYPPAVPSINHQLALAINLSAVPAINRPTSDRYCALRLRLPVSLRLASTANLPALPSYQPPTCVDCQHSGFAILSASDLHRLPTFRLCLPTNL